MMLYEWVWVVCVGLGYANTGHLAGTHSGLHALGPGEKDTFGQ